MNFYFFEEPLLHQKIPKNILAEKLDIRVSKPFKLNKDYFYKMILLPGRAALRLTHKILNMNKKK